MSEKEKNPAELKELLAEVKEHIIVEQYNTKDIDKINEVIAFLDGLTLTDGILLESECEMEPLTGIVIQNSTVFIGKCQE